MSSKSEETWSEIPQILYDDKNKTKYQRLRFFGKVNTMHKISFSRFVSLNAAQMLRVSVTLDKLYQLFIDSLLDVHTQNHFSVDLPVIHLDGKTTSSFFSLMPWLELMSRTESIVCWKGNNNSPQNSVEQIQKVKSSVNMQSNASMKETHTRFRSYSCASLWHIHLNWSRIHTTHTECTQRFELHNLNLFEILPQRTNPLRMIATDGNGF